MQHALCIAWGTLLAAVGCGQGVPGTRLASFEGIAEQLFATSAHVVWLEGIRGSLLRAPLAGGVAEIVPGVERVIRATQDGDDLYVTTGIEEMQPIVRVSTVGSAAPTRVATSERHVRALGARDGHVAWIENGATDGPCFDAQQPRPGGRLFHLAPGATTPTLLADDVAGCVFQLRLAGSTVYASSDEAGTLRRFGPAPATLATGAAMRLVALTDTSLFFFSNGTIEELDLATNARRIVARDIAIGSTAPLVLGPKSLYWGDNGRTRIAEAPRAGGASKITVPDVNTIIPSLAVRDRFLYFALDSGCNSRPWNGACESELASRAHVFRLPIQ